MALNTRATSPGGLTISRPWEKSLRNRKCAVKSSSYLLMNEVHGKCNSKWKKVGFSFFLYQKEHKHISTDNKTGRRPLQAIKN